MEKRKDIHLEKFKSASATILLCFIGLWAYSFDYLQVSPVEIYFNHEAGHTRDAVTISDDGTAIVNDPEWEDWCGEKHKFAYIKSQANRSIKVQLSAGSYSGLMHLLIKVSYVSGHTDGIGTVCNLFVSNFNIDSLLTLYPTGGFSASVGVHEFQWRWEIYAIPVNNSNYCAAWDTTYTSHHFYTLLAAPQAPMAQPWESVLNYACFWANNQNSDIGVTTKVTNSLYNIGYNYAINSGSSRYSSLSDPSIFQLGFVMSEISNPVGISVNCVDLSRIVVIFSNALGVNLKTKRFYDSNGNISVNCIDLIGGNVGVTNDPFGTNVISNDCRANGFTFHSVAKNEVNTDSLVWDATLKYDTDADPDNVNNPYDSGCGTLSTYQSFSWELPSGVTISTYLGKLVDNYVYGKSCNSQNNYCGSLVTNYFTIVNY